MNCFVVGTGRCGTSSFYQAAKHIRGWTAGHETAAGYIGRLSYPPRHIEVDYSLVYRIPEMKSLYPAAKWVHLIRDRESCIRSLAMSGYQLTKAYAYLWHQVNTTFNVYDAAESYYDRTNELITALLPEAIIIEIETMSIQWPGFCEWLGVTCAPAVNKEFKRAYNPQVARGRDSYVELI